MRALLPAGLLIVVLALAACTQPVVVGCPRPADYPKEFQAAILAEVRALAATSPLRRAMEDYLKLRDQARACAQ